MKAEVLLPPEPGAIAAARRFVAEALSDLDDATLDAVKLMVSELATNAFEHGATEFVVAVERSGDEVRVSVTDSGGGHPEVQSPQEREPRGRGLRIVDALASDWGVTSADGATTVWFEVVLRADGDGEGSAAGNATNQAPRASRSRGRPGGRRTSAGAFGPVPTARPAAAAA